MPATDICLFLEGSFTPLLGVNQGLTAANCTHQQAASGPVQPRPPEATRAFSGTSSNYKSLHLFRTNCKVNILNIHLLLMYRNEALRESKQFGMSGEAVGRVRRDGWSQILFQNHVFAFLLIFVLKLGSF